MVEHEHPGGASRSVVSLPAWFSSSLTEEGHRGRPNCSAKKQESDPTMTHNQSALTTLITEVLADPDLAHSDVFRRMLQAGLQDLIDAEATVRIGAAPHERTPGRTTRRNGTRPKTLATPAGEVALAIPKLREGSFFPSLLHPRRRVDKALYAVICQAWIDGVSTRKVALHT